MFLDFILFLFYEVFVDSDTWKVSSTMLLFDCFILISARLEPGTSV